MTLNLELGMDSWTFDYVIWTDWYINGVCVLNGQNPLTRVELVAFVFSDNTCIQLSSIEEHEK